MRTTLTLLAALAVAGFAMPVRAQGLALNTGLWEITSTGGGSGNQQMPQIPADQLSKLTPEQQAMAQQRMAAATAPKTITHKVCITRAMLDKGMAAEEQRHNCTRSDVSSSPTALSFKLTCTGEHQATGSIHVDAPEPTSMSMTMDLQMTMKDGQAMSMHRTSQGKWLAADCGNIKPMVQ